MQFLPLHPRGATPVLHDDPTRRAFSALPRCPSACCAVAMISDTVALHGDLARRAAIVLLREGRRQQPEKGRQRKKCAGDESVAQQLRDLILLTWPRV